MAGPQFKVLTCGTMDTFEVLVMKSWESVRDRTTWQRNVAAARLLAFR